MRVAREKKEMWVCYNGNKMVKKNSVYHVIFGTVMIKGKKIRMTTLWVIRAIHHACSALIGTGIGRFFKT